MTTVITTAVIGGVITALLGIFTWTIQKKLNKMESSREEARAEAKQRDLELEEREAAMREGLKTILEARLHELHDKYMERGAISKPGYLLWRKLFAAYVALKGNSVVEHMDDDIGELPYDHPKKRPNRADRYAEEHIEEYRKGENNAQTKN